MVTIWVAMGVTIATVAIGVPESFPFVPYPIEICPLS